METQLAQLKAESDTAQDKLVKLQRETGVVQVAGSTSDDGHPQGYSSSVDQYQKATAQLSQAQTNRIQKGAIYEIMKSGNPETIVGLSQNPLLSGAAAGMSGRTRSDIQPAHAGEHRQGADRRSFGKVRTELSQSGGVKS